MFSERNNNKMNITYRKFMNFLLIIIGTINIMMTSQLNLQISYNIRQRMTVFFLVVFILLYLVSLIIEPFQLVDVCFLLFILLIVFLSRKNYVINAGTLTLVYSRLSIKDIISNYKYSILYSTLAVVFLSLSGILSIYDPQGTGLSLGFNNVNQLGFYLGFLAILFTFRIGEQNSMITLKYNRYNITFLVFVVIFEFLIIQDNTAGVMVLFFYLASLFKTTANYLKPLIIILPIVLTIFAYWAGFHYFQYHFLETIDSIVTRRIFIWNHYLTSFPLTKFGTNWQADPNFINGFFDGAYIYYGIFYGIVILSVLLIGLALTNYKLVKSNQVILLILIISLEIVGFSENALFAYVQSPGLIFAFLGYFPGYFRRGNTIEENTLYRRRS